MQQLVRRASLPSSYYIRNLTSLQSRSSLGRPDQLASRRSRWAPSLHLRWRTTCQPPKGRHLPFHKRSQFHSATNLRQAEAFYTQHQDPTSAAALPLLRTPPKIPQTRTEKIVQRHTVDLPKGKLVQSGDYVTLSPRHCMTVSCPNTLYSMHTHTFSA